MARGPVGLVKAALRPVFWPLWNAPPLGVVIGTGCLHGGGVPLCCWVGSSTPYIGVLAFGCGSRLWPWSLLTPPFPPQIAVQNPLVSERLELSVLYKEYAEDDNIYQQKIKVGWARGGGTSAGSQRPRNPQHPTLLHSWVSQDPPIMWEPGLLKACLLGGNVVAGGELTVSGPPMGHGVCGVSPHPSETLQPPF